MNFYFTFCLYFIGTITSVLTLFLYTVINYDSVLSSLYFLTTSKAGIAVYANCICFFYVILVSAFTKFLVDPISQVETERFIEAGEVFLTDTVLFLVLSNPTIDGEPVSATWLFVYVFFLLLLKFYHFLAHFRVSYVLGSSFPRNVVLLKLFCLIIVVLVVDGVLCFYLGSQVNRHSSIYVWLIFEVLELFVNAIQSAVKYFIYYVDHLLDGAWTPKNSYIFSMEILHDCCTLILSLIFIIAFIIYFPNKIPLHMTSDMFSVGASLYEKIKSLKKYQKLMRVMSTAFPEATFEQLEEADTCIVCRDILTEGSRRLPCNHVFHVHCLKAWFLQQQLCPTCRTDISVQTSTTDSAKEVQSNVPYQEQPGRSTPLDESPSQIEFREIVLESEQATIHSDDDIIEHSNVSVLQSLRQRFGKAIRNCLPEYVDDYIQSLYQKDTFTDHCLNTSVAMSSDKKSVLFDDELTDFDEDIDVPHTLLKTKAKDLADTFQKYTQYWLHALVNDSFQNLPKPPTVAESTLIFCQNKSPEHYKLLEDNLKFAEHFLLRS